jgi:hypothetical protein
VNSEVRNCRNISNNLNYSTYIFFYWNERKTRQEFSWKKKDIFVLLWWGVSVNNRNRGLWWVHCQSPDWRIDMEIGWILTDWGKLCARRETCRNTTVCSTKMTVVTLVLSLSLVALRSLNYPN